MQELLEKWGVHAALMAIQGLFFWVVWSLGRKFVGCPDCERHRKGLHERMDAIERKHLDSNSAVREQVARLEGELRERMAALDGKISTATEVSKRIEGQVGLLLEFHLGEGK